MRPRTTRAREAASAGGLTCLSVSRMILKSDGIIPPPPAAPAPEPPASSNQVDGKSAAGAGAACRPLQNEPVALASALLTCLCAVSATVSYRVAKVAVR